MSLCARAKYAPSRPAHNKKVPSIHPPPALLTADPKLIGPWYSRLPSPSRHTAVNVVLNPKICRPGTNIRQCNYPLTGTAPSTVFLAAATGTGTTPSLPPTAATVTAALAAAAVRLALALVPVRFVM